MSSYLTAMLGGAAAMVVSVVGATWFLNDKISEVRQDVAIVKVQVESLSRVTEIGGGDAQQSQYVLVQLPSDSQRSELIREILAKQGKINGTP